ncbi:MAG: YggT family protein [Coriobacteriia bacterium]|nr:YggT family protein [Coriobacteriia bacterium]
MNLIPSLLTTSYTATYARLFSYEAAVILTGIVNFFVFVVLVWAVLSWFRGRGGFLNDIYQALDKLIGPIMKPFKKLMPATGGVDFTPFIVIVLLQVIVRVLISL